MAIVVEKTNNNVVMNNGVVGENTNTVVLAKDLNTAIVETKQNDVRAMTDWREQRKAELVRTGELDQLTSLINITDAQTIITFGKEPAMMLSKCSDDVLAKYDASSTVETTKLMNAVTKIMDQIDLNEIAKEDSSKFGFFKKFKQEHLDKLVRKYNSIGSNLETICVELTKHDQALIENSKETDKLHEAYVKLYHKLCDYIIAGDQAIVEVDNYLSDLSGQMVSGKADPSTELAFSDASQAKLQLEQRVQELRTVETIALQSIPMLQSYKFNNLNLSRKINSAFIITIPVFKGAIAQAVLQKQQRLTAEGLEKFDQKTNEMLIRNSANARDNMVRIAQLSTQQTIKLETLQESWKNIADGISQVQDIVKNMHNNIENDKVALNNMNAGYIAQLRGNN